MLMESARSNVVVALIEISHFVYKTKFKIKVVKKYSVLPNVRKKKSIRKLPVTSTKRRKDSISISFVKQLNTPFRWSQKTPALTAFDGSRCLYPM